MNVYFIITANSFGFNTSPPTGFNTLVSYVTDTSTSSSTVAVFWQAGASLDEIAVAAANAVAAATGASLANVHRAS